MEKDCYYQTSSVFGYTFTMNNNNANAIQVQGFSDITLPVYIQHNQMTSNGNATGIFLSTIT